MGLGKEVAATGAAFVMVNRLHQEVGSAGLQGLVTYVNIFNGSHHDDRDMCVSWIRTEFSDELDTVHFRHFVIHQYQVGGHYCSPSERLNRVRKGLYNEVLFKRTDQLLQDFPAGKLVINNQDRCHLSSLSPNINIEENSSWSIRDHSRRAQAVTRERLVTI